MKSYNSVVVHFGEIWLKGRNRGFFIKKLKENIKDALKDEKYEGLEDMRDRFVINLKKNSKLDSIMKKLGTVFGISWFAPVILTSTKLKDIVDSSKGLYKKGERVRVEAHRSYKELPYTSVDIVTAFIKNEKRLGYNLDRDSEKELLINVKKDGTYISCNKVRGPGGLPVGSSGRAVVLLSGGIDSPVASFYAMKKGLIPVYIHIHAFAKNDEAAKSKMKDTLKLLAQYSKKARVYYVPSYIFQASVMKIDKKYELILFKRFLYKLAEKIAETEGAKVIVTGESLGQVASQTVDNLIATERDVSSLIYRPLIGFDKQEIINKATEIGSYELSIKKYPDVCSFRAQNPTTNADYKVIDKMYKETKMDSVIKKTLAKTDTVEIRR